MKISQFAKKTQLTVDTIRYYQELGLIIPIKIGSQYDYDDRCIKDLEDILSFKSMGFSLNEIKTILSFKRLGKLSNYQEDAYYQDIFSNKHLEIIKEIENLNHVKFILESNMKKLNEKSNKVISKIGIDLEVLPLLTCPNCREPLTLLEGEIINNQVINGNLSCVCDSEYKIIDGILAMNVVDEEYNINSIYDLIKDTPVDFLNNLYKDIEFAYKKIDFSLLRNKTILELNVGFGIFLRHIYDDIPNDAIYFAVDQDINKIKILKYFLEQTQPKKINFICGDYLELPIKKHSIDILFDNYASSVHGFTNTDFLLPKIFDYLKPHAYFIGVYAIFKTFSSDSYIAPEFRKNVVLENIKKYFYNFDFKPIYEFSSDYLTNSGKHETYFNDEELVYRYYFYGKR